MYTYKTTGTCSRSIDFDIDDAGIITAVSFEGGCNGNLKGISRLTVGRPASEVIEVLKGTTCGKRPTSCPDQLARALEQALEQA
jgi:uncharacterized protein (TIGR03905 family)